MSENATTCINCQTPITSDYCPNCGQKKDVRPVSWRGLFDEFNAMWWGIDNKLIRTVWGLIVRPATVINAYLDGNRVRYIGPLSYLIVMSAVYILTFEFTGVSPKEFIQMSSEQFQAPPTEVNQKAFIEDYMQSISDNMRLMAGALIPFLALGMLIFYRKHNYLQNFLIATYATSQLLWLSVLSVIIYATTGWGIQIYLSIPSLIYMIWIFGKLNPQKNRIWTWLKAFFAWVVGYLFFFIIISVVGIAYFVLFVIER